MSVYDPDEGPHFNQLATSDVTNWVTPQSSLKIDRNSRGVNYEIKVYTDDGSEVLDTGPNGLLAQFAQFDRAFCAEFGIPRNRTTGRTSKET